MKDYYLGYSYEIRQENGSRWCFTVRNSQGWICDGGYSRTQNGAYRKALRLIKMFAQGGQE